MDKKSPAYVKLIEILIKSDWEKRKAWINKRFSLVIIIRIEPLSALNVKHTGKWNELLVAQYKNICTA